MWEIELPWPPSLNSIKAAVNGRLILSKKCRDYYMQCRVAVNSLYGLKLTDDLEVTIALYPPDNRKRDIDNHIKAVFDAMTHSKVWIDDSQIKDLRVRMREIEKGGKAVIKIDAKRPDIWLIY